ncbi:hypothetical protein ACPPVO_18225 [Dactylosporangium sp. McL0621]|uniref:hypothetical protein n=1 Tax=Dactylosporangium sp. McL0621 TaxID=3415678 RepID=UPI003CF972EA
MLNHTAPRRLAVLVAAVSLAAPAVAAEHATAHVSRVVADPPPSTGGAGPGTDRP